MGPIFASTVIDAPRERIFGLVADLANRPGFCDHFQLEYRLERLDSEGVGAAARFRVEAPMNHVWADTRIEGIEPPHLVREQGHGGRWNRVPTHTVWEVLEGPGSAATVKVAFWTEPTHPIDKIKERFGATRWHGRQLRRALERLGDLAEAEGPEVGRLATVAG